MKRVRKLSWYLVLVAVCFSLLILTKVFFVYVLYVFGLAALGLYLFGKTAAGLRLIPILLTTLVFCVPYLMYTFSLTGRPLYWQAPAGMYCTG